MAEVIIVTKQCYLVAESINHISIHEMSESEKDDSLMWSAPSTRDRRRARKMTPKQKLLDSLKKQAQLYQITINFTAGHQNQNSSSIHKSGHGGSVDTVNITVRGYDRALELYQDMLRQIREQLPDKLFLDKMVENFFTENPVTPENTK